MDAWVPPALHFAQSRCEGCGLLISQPQAAEAEMDAYYGGAYYEEHWPDPAATLGRNAELHRRYELPLMARLWSAWPPPAEATVAEVGCGYGAMMHVLRETGFRPRGCDLSPRAVAVCRGRGLDVVEGKSPALPQPRGTFDVAITRHVIEHLPDPRVFVKEMVELVRPAGVVVIATEDAWTSQYAWDRLRARMTGRIPAFRSSTDHTFVFRAQHLRALLLEAGCDDVRTASFSLPPARESLHWRLYKGLFRSLDRMLGHGEFLMAAGRRARED
ncbi:MAG TPA: class I SAM-dependent methyltransferase [Candidatus Bathyarchaeia archaeon]|nr:class I SAM-dependent methyltransferase [Candidatus Bathyarchaeia archaeon]